MGVMESGEPVFSIPALLDAAGQLAEVLIALTAPPKQPGYEERPLRRAVFANSGSEAVEWAFKIARSHTNRQGVGLPSLF